MIKKIKVIWTFLRKHFDKALYRGGWMQFILLATFVFFLCAVGVGVSACFNVDGWRVIELLLDPGSFCDSDEEACGKANIYFQLIVTLLGAVFFTSFLIGSVGNFLERRIDRYRNGGVAYEVDNHILIIGAGEPDKITVGGGSEHQARHRYPYFKRRGRSTCPCLFRNPQEVHTQHLCILWKSYAERHFE